ncbi:MAG TPA: magnesium transporter, partial [Thermomicrobiales bacterium]|nr:magnesium transporter [Thermomicrobiales bacterium]
MFAQETLIEDVHALIEAQDAAAILALSEELNSNDWSDVLPHLDDEEIAYLLAVLPDTELPIILTELDPAHAAEILRTIPQADAADVLEAMDPDDATDVIDEFSADEAEQILVHMDAEDAAEIRELLAYPEDTAGGIMTPSFVAIEPEMRADQAIVALRKISEEVETMYYVYVLDPEEHLLGVLSLYRIVLTRPDTPVRDLMVSEPVTVLVDADQETAANLLNDHNLLALPVVDHDNRLLGIITQDDVADILQAEVTEDIERLGGSQPLEVPYRRAGALLLFRRRIPWLLLLFMAEAYTGTVLRHYESEITQVVALSFFIPLLIGTGGNIGSQVTTTLVRALA